VTPPSDSNPKTEPQPGDPKGAPSAGLGRGLGLGIGRCFVDPSFDYLLIGGGLSLPVIALVLAGPDAPLVGPLAASLDALTTPMLLPVVMLLFSTTHFAASTVRLYTKPGATRSLPFLTMAFPLVALALLTLCIVDSDRLGHHLRQLYFTWSPFHYAAQAYGLSVMYCHRSGCTLGVGDKRMIRWISLMAFFYSSISSGAGLYWILPRSVLESSFVVASLDALRPLLIAAGVLGPLALWLRLRRRSQTLPAICALLLLVNGFWWFALPATQAFLWATFFHGIQYLAIVLVFHVKEQIGRPDNRHGRAYHVAWFYGACALLAYALFNCLPQAYSLAGFSLTESLLLVVAAINIHHFIVDAYIWRQGPQDANRSVIESDSALAATAGAPLVVGSAIEAVDH
jgi:hypothetical protein